MAYENLLKSIDESAEERERDLRQRAQHFAEKIRNGAAKKANMIRRMLSDEAERAATVEQNKRMYLTKAEIKKNHITIWEGIYMQAFASARVQLTKIRTDPNYTDIFKNLALEAIDALDQQECELHIDKRDEELCRKTMIAINRKYTVVADLQTMGGLEVCSSDTLIRISNTIESRLERGRERLKCEVYAVLSGG